MSELLNEDYEKVFSTTLLYFDKYPSDIYLLYSGGKLKKVFLQNDAVDYEALDKLLDEGGINFYVTKMDFTDYIGGEIAKQFKKIETLFFRSEMLTTFTIYVYKSSQYVEFISKGTYLRKKHIDLMNQISVFCTHEEYKEYQQFFDRCNINDIMESPDIPTREKSTIFAQSQTRSVKDTYENFSFQKVGNITKNISSYVHVKDSNCYAELREVEQDESVFFHALNVSTIACLLYEMMYDNRDNPKMEKLIEPFRPILENYDEGNEILLTAAILHDIGKSELQNENPDFIRTMHPLFGHKKIIESSDTANARYVADIILEHHEHCDGSGFPMRLKKERISLFAQIVTLVDYYENRLSSSGESVADAITDVWENQEKFNPSLIELLEMSIS